MNVPVPTIIWHTALTVTVPTYSGRVQRRDTAVEKLSAVPISAGHTTFCIMYIMMCDERRLATAYQFSYCVACQYCFSGVVCACLSILCLFIFGFRETVSNRAR